MSTNPQERAVDIAQVIAALGLEPAERIAVSTKPRDGKFSSQTYPVADVPAAIAAATVDKRDVYFCPNPTSETRPGRKGYAVDTTRVTALPCDLDAKAGGQETMATCEAVIADLTGMLGTPPTVTINSGHGLQPLWAVADAEISDGGYGQAKRTVERWGDLVKLVAKQHGGTVDSVFNLDRLARVPGSVNYKDRTTPVPATAELPGGQALTLAQLNEIFDTYNIGERQEGTAPAQDIEPPEWDFARFQSCRYATTTIDGWKTDEPTSRHQWLLSQAIRLATMGRLGCLTENGYNEAVEVLEDRFHELLQRAPTREPGDGEVARALRDGAQRAAAKSDEEARKELGNHRHSSEHEDIDAKARELIVLHKAKELAAAVIEAETPQPTIPACKLADIASEPVKYRWESLLVEEGRLLIVAQRKTGKTTLIANIASSYLDGTEALGRFPTNATGRNVLFLNFEVSPNQAAAWLRDLKLDEQRIIVASLRGSANPFATAQGRKQLAALIKKHNIGLVIVDPFARAYTGKSQNDAAEVTNFLVMLDQVVTEGGADEVIVTHHAGWEGERSRGSTALEDWPDTVLTLVKDKDTGARFATAFGRDVDIAEDRLDYDTETRALTFAGSGSRATARSTDRLATLTDLIVELVAQNPGATTNRLDELARQDGSAAFQKGEVSKAAQLAAMQSRIRRERGKRSAWHHFPIDENTTTPDYPPTDETATTPDHPPADASHMRQGIQPETPTTPHYPQGAVPPTTPDLLKEGGGLGVVGAPQSPPALASVATTAEPDPCALCSSPLDSPAHLHDCIVGAASVTWDNVADRANNDAVTTFLRARFDDATEANALLSFVEAHGYAIHHDQNWRPGPSSKHPPYPSDYQLDELARPVILRRTNKTQRRAILSHPTTASSVGQDLGPAPYHPWLRAELHACRCDECQPESTP